ncbi:benzoate/H(+) symporter BenE family transporter [Phaeobacter gallaeciensis]|uniref:benzoate/H(+) symporter BenE family transporter n=1 Tax=Phaeobacter gallaeciensis TaxID=60890 RepID=UPI000BBBDC52|nr:benzoate/H(+) symporter BenE family transporter [Phaeobacter gallaeciensis]ATF17195.1 putative inner membrane transport protein [Phaeobacter gallaeciensis]ATF21304.1 putative inner membrane transport protein [Phaeobacter gallaeciensis]
MLNSLKLSHIVAGAVAVLVGYTGSVAIIFQAIEASGASQAQANSWMLALGLGMGLSSLVLSLMYRMPILTAWSTPGAALLAVSLTDVPLSDAIGAFLFCAALLILTGVTGWFAALSRLIPDALANAMLAGLLFPFGLAAFSAFQSDAALVAAMTVTFVAGRRLFARYAIPAVLTVGILWCLGNGSLTNTASLDLTLAQPVFMTPSFSLPVLIGVGLPLYIVTMSSQNMPGIVTLRAAGYTPPVSASLIVTGLTSFVLAPFGGFAFNLAAITAAIGCGPEADENPKTRYMAGVMTGVFYILVGLGGATVISLFLIAPKALVATVAGLALLSTIGNSLSAALGIAQGRDAALITFMVTVSGVSFFGIGAAFWALVVGIAVNQVITPPPPNTATADTAADPARS